MMMNQRGEKHLETSGGEEPRENFGNEHNGDVKSKEERTQKTGCPLLSVPRYSAALLGAGASKHT